MNINSAFPTKYISAPDLNGKAVRVTIDAVTSEKVGDDNKPVMHFVGKEKGFVLNRVNSAILTNAIGSPETDNWIGWSIVIYPTMAQFQGKPTPCIRVDDRPGSSRGPARPVAVPSPAVVDDAAPVDIPEDEIPF